MHCFILIIPVLVVLQINVSGCAQKAGIHNKIDDFESQSLECPQGCPRILQPVCAYDDENNHKYFQNDCLMHMHQCETQTSWHLTKMYACSHLLEAGHLQHCLRPCPLDYMPVCAKSTDKIEVFRNECVFRIENCFANGAWTKLREDDCVYVLFANSIQNRGGK